MTIPHENPGITLARQLTAARLSDFDIALKKDQERRAAERERERQARTTSTPSTPVEVPTAPPEKTWERVVISGLEQEISSMLASLARLYAAAHLAKTTGGSGYKAALLSIIGDELRDIIEKSGRPVRYPEGFTPPTFGDRSDAE